MSLLFGDPLNLQGGNQNLQGGSAAGLQPAGNPQQTYGPVPPVTPAPAMPIGGQPSNKTYYPQQQPKATAQPVQLDPLYAQIIGTRASSVNPGVLEYYNAENGAGFSNERDVLNYVLTRTGRNLSSLSELNAAPSGQSQGAVAFPNAPTSTPATPADPNQALARAAAQAGLSVDDYLKLTSGQYAVTPEERAKINEGLGIPGLESTLFTPPSKTTQQIYQDAFNQAGLADLKAKIAELDSRVAAIKQKYTDKQGTVNENPFLSEASRTGRLKNLNDQGNAEIGNLMDEQQRYVDLYNSGINEVNNLVTRTTADFSSNQTFNAQKLQYLQTKAEQQIQDLQSKKSSQAYAYLPDYLQAKVKAAKPDTIGSAESGYFRWNPDTGTFEQVIAPQSKDSYSLGFDPISGQPYVLNKNTGTLNGNGGGANYGEGLKFNTGSTGMRTDRNNNPTAFTTDVAKLAGLVEGVDYVAGDPFPGNSNLKTAKLLGDPITTTIKAIDKVGFYTQSGQPRWTYIDQIPDAKNWANLSYDQKARVVAQMYQREGGNGSLVQGASQLGNNTVDNLVQQVISNPQLLTQLPEAQQKAVTARMAQLGLQIPNTKQPTDAQNSASGYATRVQQSGQILDQLESSIAGYNIIGFKAQQAAPNNLKSSTIQQYEQAARNFINAVLRRESGAAIAQSEFDNAYQQYLPYPGDSQQVLIQKKQNRDAVLNSLKQASGSAGGLQMPSNYPSSPANLSDLNFSF